MNVAFDRIEKAWMTVGGGGGDERVEWPEPVYELEDSRAMNFTRFREEPFSHRWRGRV